MIRRISSMTFAIFVIAEIGLFPGYGYAQQMARGAFSLSQEVHWGSTVLPKGDYTYSVDAQNEPAVVRVFQKGGSFSGLFLPQTFSEERYSGPDQIVLERIGGDMFVAAMHVGSLGTELIFFNSGASEDVRPPELTPVQLSVASGAVAVETFTIVNPNHEKVTIAEVQKIYLSACEAVERKLDWPSPIRPRFILRLGAPENVLRFSSVEILLKKWDDFRFAEAIVDLALRELVSPEERERLSNLAVVQAGATTNLCELKHCVN